MTRSRLAHAALLLGVAVLAFAGTAAAADTPLVPVLSEEFSSYPPAGLRTTFSSAGVWGPGSGTVSASEGALSLKPISTRGTAVLFTDAPAFTELPARVTFRVRYPLASYRVAKMLVYASAPYTAGGSSTGAAKLVDFNLGTTGYSSLTWPLQLRASNLGKLSGPSLNPTPVLPSDQWLEGELYIDMNSVRGTINGRTLTASHDFSSRAGQGLYLGLQESDDITPGGLQFDYLRIEQAQAEAPNAAPIAVLSSAIENRVGESFAFDGAGSLDPDGSLVSYVWSFGDGSSGSGPLASHAYAAPGSYRVTLTVTDDDGASAITATTVSVIGVPPVARIAAPDSQLAGLPVVFDGSGSTDADGSIVEYSWDFGDGSSASGSKVTHTFTSPGDYQVKLTVVDDSGQSAQAASTLTVDPASAGIERLIAEVEKAKLNAGQKQKLLVELRAALAAAKAGKPVLAASALQKFVWKLGPDKHVSLATKASWAAQAANVMRSLAADTLNKPGMGGPTRAASARPR